MPALNEKLLQTVAVMARRVPRTASEVAGLVDITEVTATKQLHEMHEAGLIEFHSFDSRPRTRGPKPARWRWREQR